MTVSTTTNRQSATGDGSTTVFAFTFRMLEETDMDVYVDGVLQGSGYTVDIDSDGVGGTVTFTSAPADDAELLFVRSLDLTQETSLPTEGNISEEEVENVFDKLTILVQQVAEETNRALTLPIESSLSGEFSNEPTDTLILPVWDDDDQMFEFKSVSNVITEALPSLNGGDISGPGSSSDHGVPLWNGTGGSTLRAGSAPGVAGTVFMSNGVSSDPTFQALTVDVRVGHRLTLTTGTPVTVSDVTGAGTIYWTPYKSRTTWLRYAAGSNVWKPYNLAELSLALTLTSGSVYDVFVEASSESAAALSTLVWTNSTTRATALAYDATSGYLVKSGDTSKVYLGTIYATGTNQTEDSAARRMLWNYYNRVTKRLFSTEATNTWAYATATFRPINNVTTTGVSRFDFVIGVQEEAISTYAQTEFSNGVTADTAEIGIALDSTTTPNVSRASSFAANNIFSLGIVFVTVPAIGYHFMQQLEKAGTVGQTFRGDNGGTVPLTYMSATMAA